MSRDPGVYVTVNVYADTPMELTIGERTAALSIGQLDSVTLEFDTVDAARQLEERLRVALADHDNPGGGV